MTNKDYIISIENVNFVGIGKLLFNVNAAWNIPQLHFLMSKEKDVFEAVNLEMQLFASGKTEDEAIASLINLTMYHIDNVIKNIGYQQFIDDAKSCVLENYWSKYRELEFIAASKKQDLSNDIEQRIENTLKKMIEEEFERQNINISDLVSRLFGYPKVMYRTAA